MPIPSARKMAPIVGVVLTVTSVSLALIPPGLWGYDAWIMYQVAESMVNDGSFLVHEDGLGLNTPYSSYGIGMSLLMAVAIHASRLFSADPAQLTTLINPILLGLLAGVLWAMARRVGLTSRQAAASSLVVCLATLLLPYSATGFSEVGTALGVGLGLLGLYLARDKPWTGGILAGAGIGLAVMMRQDSAVLVAPAIAVGVGLVAAQHRRLAALAAMCCGGLPAAIVVGGYNQLRFGSPLSFEYVGRSITDSFSQPFLTGFYGLTASPGRGLLLYTPLVLVIAFTFRSAWRRSAVITAVCVALLLGRILFYSSWWAWHGGVGWGPRFLVPAMPALLLFVAEAIRRLPTAHTFARIGFATLVAIGFGFGVAGAATDQTSGKAIAMVNQGAKWDPTKIPFMDWAVSSEAMTTWNVPFLTWSVTPLKDHAGMLLHRQHIISRFISRPIHWKALTLLGLVASAGLVAAWVNPSRREEEEPDHGQVGAEGVASPT